MYVPPAQSLAVGTMGRCLYCALTKVLKVGMIILRVGLILDLAAVGKKGVEMVLTDDEVQFDQQKQSLYAIPSKLLSTTCSAYIHYHRQKPCENKSHEIRLEDCEPHPAWGN